MYLLDTHTVLWAMADDPRLGSAARDLFADDSAPLVLSVASVWEMAIKVSLGKLTLGAPLAELVERDLPIMGIPTMGIEARHALAVKGLPWHHRDPFDRVLAATALVDRLVLVSRDGVFDTYGTRRVW